MSNTLYPNARKIKRYGWKKSLPDFRDIKYAAPHMAALPSSVDLRPGCPAVYDQGDLGSCTANAIAGLGEFLLKKEGKKSFTPSRLFIYYNERVMEGSVNEDAGAEIKDGFSVIANQGCPNESLWWYNIAKFKVKPSKSVYTDGLKHQVVRYSRVNNANLNDMRTCLATGYPIVGGFTVYSSFESNTVARTGIVPLPRANEQILGGHAILVVGYDDSKQMFITRNSWGPNWGLKGYFMMPYAYFTNTQLSDDWWTGSFIN